MIKRPLNERFGDAVREGLKVTTIRAQAWPVRKPIMLYHWSGKPYRSKHVDVCAVEVQLATSVVVYRVGGLIFYDYGDELDLGRWLWECEGFDSEAEMDAWFGAELDRAGVERLDLSLMVFRKLEGGVV